MAKVADVPEASDMINIFEECVHKRKCSEVKEHIIQQYINPDHLTLIVAKLNSEDDLIVSDLIKYSRKLESIFGIPGGTIFGIPAESSIPISSEEGCLKFVLFYTIAVCMLIKL